MISFFLAKDMVFAVRSRFVAHSVDAKLVEALADWNKDHGLGGILCNLGE